MFFYSLTILVLCAAFVRLRRAAPFLARPYRIPLDGWKLVVFVALPPSACAVLLIAFSNLLTWVMGMSFVALCMISWFPYKRWVQKTMAI